MLDLIVYEPKSVALVVLLLLSFVLPYFASRATSERAVQIAFSGQALLAVAGLLVLLLPRFIYVEMAGAVAGCAVFAYVLTQLQPDAKEQQPIA